MTQQLEHSPQPWVNWLASLPRRQHTAGDAWLERDIDVALAAADRRRLAVTPTTQRFSSMWAEFRQQHEALESTEWRRYLRYLIWRAAVLKVRLKQQSQDVIDFDQCREALAATERQIAGDDADIDNWLWKAPPHDWADAPRSPHPLCLYAATVLSLAGTKAPAREAPE